MARKKPPVIKTGKLPPPGPPSVGVYTLGPAERIQILCLSSRLCELTTHWSGSHTRPCTEPQEECKGCIAEHATRYMALIHCLDQSKRKQMILQLTPGVVHKILAQLKDDLLRGSMWEISRLRKDARGELAACLLTQYRSPLKLPDEIDPMIVMRKIWRLD